MDITAKATVNGKPAGEWFRGFARKWRPEGAKGLVRGAEEVLETIARVAKTSTYMASGLKVRSGALRGSIGMRSFPGIWSVKAVRRGKGIRVESEIGSRLVYAIIQEKGKVIRAKRGDYLVFPIRNPGGGMTIVGWAKKKEVRIPARPFLEPAIQRVARNQAMKIIHAAYKDAIREAAR